MSIGSEALHRFRTWLPGELEYSVSKASYAKKVGRATLPIADNTSIYGYLSSEWFNHNFLKEKSAHYKPFHGMSAQLQLAKFAAGLFDKAGVGLWLSSGEAPAAAAFVDSAQAAATLTLQVAPWENDETPLDFLDNKFEDTPFADGIYDIMQSIVRAKSGEGANRRVACKEVIESSLALGGLATRCYESYAASYLQPDQLVLPTSELV